MNDSTFQDLLELEVSNFGPIVEAKINLRPLTVFVGPSNTGKSYLAILIYALHRIFSRSWDNRVFILNRKLSQKAIDEVSDWAKQAFGDRMAKGSIVLPDSVTKEISFLLDARRNKYGNEIGRCFGMDSTGALIRKGKRNDADVVFRRKVSNDSAQFEYKIVFNAKKTEFGSTIPAGLSIQLDFEDPRMDNLRHKIDILSRRKGGDWNLVAWELTGDLIDLALPKLGGPLYRPAFYLPADRTGVMHAHSVVVSATIGSAPMAGLPATGTPMLSGVLADFLQQLIEIDRPRVEIGRVGSTLSRPPLAQHGGLLAGRIEEAILGGSVRVDRSETIGYPHFTYQPTGWKNPLPLMNASSMVSELAPVVLYLRHVVKPGETLIIEEPESHLHPAMQVEFTRQIAALVHAGVRVLVTTHSEWVLEELANIVRRSDLPPSRKKKEAGEVALRPDQVGAWLFKPKSRPKGSIVEEVKLDEESGLYPTDYDSVSEALYNESVNIFNRLQSGDSE